ncbi:MAG: GTP cyclohydrolase II [Sphingomonadales bacterium]
MVNAREGTMIWRDHYRALSDLRRGVPVAIQFNDQALLVVSLELALEENVAELENLSRQRPKILLTRERAAHLKISFAQDATCLAWPQWVPLDELIALGDPTKDLATPLKGPFQACDSGAPQSVQVAALQLLKQAQLLPVGLIVTCALEALEAADILVLNADQITAFAATEAQGLRPVVHAHLPLKGAEDARVFVFRPVDGGIEHLAIIVGQPHPDKPVLTRLHSECLTGDVLGSLKCDCGEQLRGALDAISKAGGGILLYLAQEGRGIGLVNKLRAYNLQDQGYDTVDANLGLGFGVDERFFAPAAVMLKKLGFKRILLLTNNPDKVEALSHFGIKVEERVPHKFPSNGHNETYLKTKRDRTGHLL